MDLDGAAVFVKVVEAGSFSGAARLLRMPKTTVSAKVAGLERRLGVGLIRRTTRKLHVTEAGERYFRHCANAVREIELGEAALLASKGTPSGVLKITAPVDLGQTLLPRIVGAYVRKYPDVGVDLLITNRAVDLVGEGVDLAVRPAAVLPDSSLVAKRFFEVHASLWASPKYLETLGRLAHPRDLAKASFVGHTAMKSLLLTNGKSQIEIPAAGRVQADDLQTIKALLMAGEGIGWLPDFLAKDAAESRMLAPVLPQWRPKLDRVYYFLHTGHKYALPKVQEFMRAALQVLELADSNSTGER